MSAADKYPFLKELGLENVHAGCFNGKWEAHGPEYTCITPNDGSTIGTVQHGNTDDYESCVAAMEKVRAEWAATPAPKRGEVVRQIGNALREHVDALGSLIALEMGKIQKEGVGEVQEFIDICDYAVGLSRMLNGSVIPSERPEHFMMEMWNPLGMVGVISAFNFPNAVLGWNAAIAMVCGNTVVWKGASSVSLVTIATTKIITDALKKCGYPPEIFTMCTGGGSTVGEAMVQDKRLGLISFTGSSQIGQHVAETVGSHLGRRAILELGGNNAMVVEADADIELAVRAAVFAAVGTAGQRCTSLRRAYVHESIFDDYVARLKKVYATVRIGSSLDDDTLCGPVHNKGAIKEFTEGLETIKAQGGTILQGGKVCDRPGTFVEPTIVTIDPKADIINTELFVPILYVLKYSTLEQAIAYNNAVPQGLSSSLFTRNAQSVFKWTGPGGSDCGIVNVNIGPSGAEIGGAFGGNKDTGHGREAGSDSWKQYMRRSTCTINYGNALPLAQGIKFE